MLYFIVYLFLEVMISSSIIASIGGLNTFFEIVLTALVGIFILKNFQYSLGESIEKVRSGKMSQEEFINANVGKALGAFLLIIPGFFTDILGILLQISAFVVLFGKIFTFKSQNTKDSTKFEYNQNYQSHTYKKRSEDEIIDVEVIDSEHTIKH